jgi:uncharacterized damage-inducible protein DinB
MRIARQEGLVTYYGPKELAAAFRTVRTNTILIAEEIPEGQYGFRATPDTRTVAETLAHVALITRLTEQVHFIERRKTLEGFDYFGFFQRLKAEEPGSKSGIVALLKSEGEKFAGLLEGMSESALAETVEPPPGMSIPGRSRFEMLLGVKEHEMHHRAQLMVIERMLGITPHLTRRMEERIAAMSAAQTSRQAGQA